MDAALGRLFIPMGGSVDNSSTPFLRAVDWETLDDAWPTHIVSGIVQYAMPDTPLYGGDNAFGVPYSPALANNVVLATKVSTNATAIYAFDTTKGTCLWQDVALPIASNSLGPVIADDLVILAGNSSLIVYTRKLQSGHIYDMAIDQTSGSWVARDITRATQAPVAAGDLAGYYGQVPRVVYRSQNGQIIELSVDPATSKWIAYNMTETSTAGNPSPYLADTPHVVFAGQ